MIFLFSHPKIITVTILENFLQDFIYTDTYMCIPICCPMSLFTNIVTYELARLEKVHNTMAFGRGARKATRNQKTINVKMPT